MSAIIIFLLTGLSIITVIVAAFALFFILDSPTNIINSIIILGFVINNNNSKYFTINYIAKIFVGI